MGLGRIICVLLPIALTVASLVCILTVCLAGITNTNLQLFEVNTANFSASSNSLRNVAKGILPRDHQISALPSVIPVLVKRAEGIDDIATKLKDAASTIGDLRTSIESGNNITAKSLNLADKYEVSLWNYCRFTQDDFNCTDPTFNWATNALNLSELETQATAEAGTNITLPNEIKTGLNSFVMVSKLTQVAYIVAIISGLVELIFGFFAMFSRVGSCLTTFISSIAITTITFASILATIQASVAAAAINGFAKAYNLRSKVNVHFLATTWLAVAFSIGAGALWAMTSCCCTSRISMGRDTRGQNSMDTEKQGSNGSYKRMNDSEN